MIATNTELQGLDIKVGAASLAGAPKRRATHLHTHTGMHIVVGCAVFVRAYKAYASGTASNFLLSLGLPLVPGSER